MYSCSPRRCRRAVGPVGRWPVILLRIRPRPRRRADGLVADLAVHVGRMISGITSARALPPSPTPRTSRRRRSAPWCSARPRWRRARLDLRPGDRGRLGGMIRAVAVLGGGGASLANAAWGYFVLPRVAAEGKAQPVPLAQRQSARRGAAAQFQPHARRDGDGWCSAPRWRISRCRASFVLYTTYRYGWASHGRAGAGLRRRVHRHRAGWAVGPAMKWLGERRAM